MLLFILNRFRLLIKCFRHPSHGREIVLELESLVGPSACEGCVFHSLPVVNGADQTLSFKAHL
jgi:hypothetical protein